jgi:hypothetical protein
VDFPFVDFLSRNGSRRERTPFETLRSRIQQGRSFQWFISEEDFLPGKISVFPFGDKRLLPSPVPPAGKSSPEEGDMRSRSDSSPPCRLLLVGEDDAAQQAVAGAVLSLAMGGQQSSTVVGLPQMLGAAAVVLGKRLAL